MTRRNDLNICADILQVARSGAKKTQIVYKANLNFKIVKGYLRRLVGGGLLQFSNDQGYVTTKKGIQFLERYEVLIPPILEREFMEETMP